MTTQPLPTQPNRHTSLLLPGARQVLIAACEDALTGALHVEFTFLRWSVRTVATASGMFELLEQRPAAVCFLASWLPDLDAHECAAELHALYPEMAILFLDGGTALPQTTKHPLRTEALHALRRAQGELDRESGDNPVSSPAEVEDAGSETPSTPVLAFPSTVTAPGAGLAVPSEKVSEVPAPTGVAASPLLPELLGADPRLLEASRRVALVAGHRTSVLVHGETGTGKELIARAIHRLSGRRGKLVAINCAAIPDTLFEAELFGHARGAFTGAQASRTGRIEAAEGGTLFLDEVGELPLALQSKLLRFLESGTIQRVGENEEVRVDVRVVTATHRKLGRMAKEGSFRLDLLHRLSAFLIQMPPLEGRSQDIDLLADNTLLRLTRPDERPKQLTPEARAALRAHPWPGNVRELQHTVERAAILAGDAPVIGLQCLDFGEALY